MNYVKHPSAHSQRLEAWLGKETCENFSKAMNTPGRHQWYGRPISIYGVPGDIEVDRFGGFCGRIKGGSEGSLQQCIEDELKKIRRERHAIATKQLGGFSSVAAWRRARKQIVQFEKTYTPGASGAAHSLWRVGAFPAAGAAAAAAPGGTVPTSATTGAISWLDPDSGKTAHTSETYQTGTVANHAVLIYDRTFAVAKTMNSTATEAVTGVPTRYQSTTSGALDSAENNFLFMECGTVLPATAHNWTTCTYTDQSGNAGATLPSVTGVSACQANRLDIPSNTFFAPLATGDTGIQALTQMQCSALVATGAIDFVIGHPLAFTVEMVVNFMHVISGINHGVLLNKMMSGACLAMLTVFPPSTSATVLTGSMMIREG